jgi:preprotein translocase subunit SecE
VAAVQGKPTAWAKFTKYLREVRSELRKVAWPNRKELITYTIVVVVTVVVVAVFSGLVDILATGVLNLLRRLGG